MNKTDAAKAKANFLAKCLDFGWDKADLDGLSALWDKHRDEYGNLRPKVESEVPDYWQRRALAAEKLITFLPRPSKEKYSSQEEDAYWEWQSLKNNPPQQ